MADKEPFEVDPYDPVAAQKQQEIQDMIAQQGDKPVERKVLHTTGLSHDQDPEASKPDETGV